MNFLYNLAMRLLGFVYARASAFNPKARLWAQGRRDIFRRLREAIDPQDDIAWFHAASLGEFEQGRPVIEAFRAKHPRMKILLTFFSPSGYEVRKNYTGADYIFYLPVDTRKNARKFIEIVRPRFAVFIKYEFWRNYLRTAHENGARVFCISAIFRPGSPFFNRWYGRWYRKVLEYFDRIFVQNADSRERLAAVGIDRVTVAGDTRFDRVWDIARQARELPILESFASDGRPVFIAGSTWPPDEELLTRLIEDAPEAKYVIVPHEIHEERIEKLTASIGDALRYTKVEPGADISGGRVLILDTIGMLSSAYRYGRYGYIGGGFGVGIHNTLEAATFGLPLAFGPNYAKFREAADLIALGGAQSVSNDEELKNWYADLRDNSASYKKASEACKNYVEAGRGATEIILSEL